MKTVKLYLPLTLLLAASLVIASKTVATYKDSQIYASQVAVKDQTKQEADKPLNDDAMISVKQLVEGYAAKYALPVEVKLEKGIVKVKSLAAKDDRGQETAGGQEKYAALENFDNVVGFFSSLSTIPYPLEYKEMCVGVECPGVFEVSLGPVGQGGPASQPVQAPTVPAGAQPTPPKMPEPPVAH